MYNDFYFKEVEGIGLKVEYWDVSKLFFKNLSSVEDSSHLANTIKFNSYKDLEYKLKIETSLDKVLFISIMSFDQVIMKLYKILTKHNCILGVFGRNVLPFGINPNMNIFDYLKKNKYTKCFKFHQFSIDENVYKKW